MGIDERLEALTHTVELLASFHQDIAARMDARDKAWEERHKAWQEGQKAGEARIARLEQVFAAIGEVILAHENRLNRLESPAN